MHIKLIKYIIKYSAFSSFGYSVSKAESDYMMIV